MRRHKHSLSHYHLLTGEMGWLMPVGVTEVLPGDTFQQRTSALIRCSPLQAPVMHPVQARIHHWFVPNRILWDEWEDFITGSDEAALNYPTVDVEDLLAFPSALDYLGVPYHKVKGGTSEERKVAALPLMAYNKIWNEFYRDQDLQTELPLTNQLLQSCSWEKDYLTSARPWAQKGTEITIPLGDKAPVRGFGKLNNTYNDPGLTGIYETGGIQRDYPSGEILDGELQVDERMVVEEDPDNPGFPGIYADLSAAEQVSILDMRKGFALQRYAEARARYGSRFTEYLQYLGIRPSDARLQRPEYLGGGKQTISFSEVLQTGPDANAGPNPVASLFGHGIAAMRTRRYRKFFEEHGHVISLLSVRPKSMYVDAQHKKWNRRYKEDYFQKELEAIGQQEVLNKEVHPHGVDANATFGYADRYREYREEPSRVSAEFRDLLDYWHLGRTWATAPDLNTGFVQCNPSKRIYSEQTQHGLWIMANHSIQARRMVNRSAAARIM